MKTLTVAKATALAARHGMRVERLGSGLTPTWTGEAVNLDNLRRASAYMARWPRGWAEPRDRAARNLVHEVGHWLLVSPARRKLPNFGLGGDNFGLSAPPSRVKDPRREEALATLLGIALTGALADIDNALDYLSAVGGYHDAWSEVGELVRRGLLTDYGAPTARALGRPR